MFERLCAHDPNKYPWTNITSLFDRVSEQSVAKKARWKFLPSAFFVGEIGMNCMS
jgi:hypothetical protein